MADQEEDQGNQEDQGDQGDQGELIPCQYCGRHFTPEAHEKHEAHCPEKLHREKFDSGKFFAVVVIGGISILSFYCT